MAMKHVHELYEALDHMEGSDYIISQAVRAVATDLSEMAAREPDKQTQRRTVLSEVAHALRLSTAGH